MNIEGQVALVTGGASGLGAETARELARRGAKVAVLDRNGEGAKNVAAEIVTRHGAGAAIGVACDIVSTDSVVAALAAATEALGAPRIVMNIAGIGTAKRLIGKDGAPITDGVFPESKEFLAGFWIVDVDTKERAYAIAAEASMAPGPGGAPLHLPIEVREVMSGPPPEAT